MSEARTSEAQKRALKKYHDKFQQVKFYCEPDLYLEMKDYCERNGDSISQFIKDAVREKMQRDSV